MKLAYIPANLAGAEAYIAKSLCLDDPEKTRAWVLKLLLQRLPVAFKLKEEVTILTMGVAFSLSYAAISKEPPTLDLALDDAAIGPTPKDHVHEVTFWIAPGI